MGALAVKAPLKAVFTGCCTSVNFILWTARDMGGMKMVG